MGKKIKLEFTPLQIDAFISIINTVEALIGCGDSEDGIEVNFDVEVTKEIKRIDRMLKSNGYKR